MHLGDALEMGIGSSWVRAEDEAVARTAELTVLLQALREESVSLANAISKASADRARDEEGFHGGRGPRGDAILKCADPFDRQQILGQAVAAAVGSDFQ